MPKPTMAIIIKDLPEYDLRSGDVATLIDFIPLNLIVYAPEKEEVTEWIT